MEMDSFRRSFDRSRQQQPNLKKPRLVEDLGSNSNNSFPQRPPPPQPPPSAAVSRRFRQGDQDSDDSSRGAYQPQNLQQQQQQHQELISQYKAALDELTFNSKPIITNLTIIAGENLLAAKAIASAICGNILEVPSDQKLPSLYLLDSIVKNIGRDYIKHFGAKLPEVFCKTYRQVDSSTNSSMRHLFGTWKGVFPPQSLQMIEKELGFTTAVNGSSSGATASRPDSLSQRQQQSIHVNPKYLEARQHLQPSSRTKGTANDSSETLVNSTKDAERLVRPSSISSGRPWADLPINKQNIQRLPSETLRQHEKSTGASYGDYDYGSELSRHSSKGIGRDKISVTEQGHNKQFYGIRSSIPETVPRQRNGLDIKHKVPNYLAPQDGNSDMHLLPLHNPVNQNSDEMTRSWKNSEEDEYMWDDLNSKLINYTAVNNSAKAQPSLNYDKLELGNHLQRSQGLHEVWPRTDRESSVDSLSTEQENQATFRHRVSPQLPVPESQSTNRRGLLATGSSSLARTGIQSQIRSSHKGASSVEFLNNSATGSISTTGQQKLQSSGDASPARKSLILQRHLPPSLSADPRQKLHNLDAQDHPQAQSLPKSQGKVLQKSTSLQRRQLSSTQQPKVEQKLSETLSPAQKPPLAARTSFKVVNPALDHLNIQPKLGNPVATDMTSESDIPPASLPSGSSPTQLTSSAATNVSNPLSNLLSSLVAKGLISSSKTETPKNIPLKVATQIKKSSGAGAASSNSKSVASLPACSYIPVSTSSTEVLFSKPPTKPSVTFNESITPDIKNLIGFEFKPDKVREFHPSVISDLFDDIPHQCSICGLRLKLQECLDQHLEWHASSHCLNASRKWFANLGNWVSREVNTTPEIEPIGFIEELTCNELDMIEHPKQMVPADENQCLCILCGELFEDFYCQESDEWMFEGATCMSHGLIVHAECMSDKAIHLLDLVKVLDS